MKTVMFKVMLPNGTEMAVVRENNTYTVQLNGKIVFTHDSYDICREVLIA